MSDNGDAAPRRDGFEYEGTFYRWHVTDIGKDLMLIDRFSGLPISEFFAVVEDTWDRGRAPILLTLIATSLRNGHPDWSVERIIRLVMETPLSEVTFVGSDEDEPAESPLPPPAEASTGAESSSESKPTSSEPEPETSETFNAIPV